MSDYIALTINSNAGASLARSARPDAPVVDWKNYGRSKTGYLAVQGDHDGVLALRNIKIRTLP